MHPKTRFYSTQPAPELSVTHLRRRPWPFRKRAPETLWLSSAALLGKADDENYRALVIEKAHAAHAPDVHDR